MRLRNWLRRALPTASAKKADKKPPLGIYLHWPFCTAICPYCDFNVHKASSDKTAQQDWLAAYRAELSHAHSLRPEGPVETVFFGGGTPSLMSAQLVGDILSAIDTLWGFAPNAEISLEANPSLKHGAMQNGAAHLQDLRTAGVTRLSLGAQAFDDAALKKLGRAHSADDAKKSFAAAQDIFPQASFDLIYARPGQSPESWHAELSAALKLGARHMSLYQLTIEPDTPFARMAADGRLIVPDEEAAADMFQLTQELCAAAGLPAYEISNHAAPSDICRHNMASWQGGDYLGIGPGAHGRLTGQDKSRLTRQGKRWATIALRHPTDWLAQIAAQGHGWQSCEALDEEDEIMEAVLLGLRLSDGIALADLAARGIELEAARVEKARADGLLSDDTTRLQASPQGRLLLDTLIGRLLVD